MANGFLTEATPVNDLISFDEVAFSKGPENRLEFIAGRVSTPPPR
jgi:hypothetical protein